MDFKLDNLPLLHPYVPRLCENQGHFLIWWGTQDTDSDLLIPCLQAKNEPQWINCDEEWKIEKGIALVYPFENEVIIGTLKVPGYYHLKRNMIEQRKWLKKMWSDIVVMFGDRKIICPSGSYFNYLHNIINKENCPREAYHRQLMKSFLFKRDGHYWVRNAKELSIMDK